VVLTNELNERDNQIALLKKKETHFEQTIQERENLFKQDTMVRMQLGKRLEQVLMDKEEALDQLDALRVSKIGASREGLLLTNNVLLCSVSNADLFYLTLGTTGCDSLARIVVLIEEWCLVQCSLPCRPALY